MSISVQPVTWLQQANPLAALQAGYQQRLAQQRMWQEERLAQQRMAQQEAQAKRDNDYRMAQLRLSEQKSALEKERYDQRFGPNSLYAQSQQADINYRNAQTARLNNPAPERPHTPTATELRIRAYTPMDTQTDLPGGSGGYDSSLFDGILSPDMQTSPEPAAPALPNDPISLQIRAQDKAKLDRQDSIISSREEEQRRRDEMDKIAGLKTAATTLIQRSEITGNKEDQKRALSLMDQIVNMSIPELPSQPVSQPAPAQSNPNSAKSLFESARSKLQSR